MSQKVPVFAAEIRKKGENWYNVIYAALKLWVKTSFHDLRKLFYKEIDKTEIIWTTTKIKL